MMLQTKIVSFLIILLMVYLALSFGIQRLVILPSYIELERDQARRDLERCTQALRLKIRQISTTAQDWAAWDDTYRFIQDRNEEYAKSNLGMTTFTVNRLDVLILCDPGGRVVWGKALDYKTGRDISLPELPLSSLPGDHPLLRNRSLEEAVAGVLVTGRGPLLVASRPILTSEHQGPIRGYLIMGRFLDRQGIAQLVEQTRVQHDYLPLDRGIGGEAVAAPGSLDLPVQPVYREAGELLKVYGTFPDIYGNPALLAEATVPREIRAKGMTTLWFVLLSTCVVGLIMLAAIILLLRGIVIRPLAGLTARVVAVGGRPEENGEAKPALSERRDEIGLLAKEFDQMLRRLWDVHRESREANRNLQNEIEERKKFEQQLMVHRSKLSALSSELLLVEERERRRIAHDLHDRVGHSLALAQMRVATLLQSVPSEEARALLAEIESQIEEVLQSTRLLTFELSPPVLYELGLTAAIEWLASEVAGRHEVDVQVYHDGGDIPMDHNLRVLTFRAVRELLHNVVKHASARHVAVHLQREAGKMRIDVIDDGTGFGAVSPDNGFSGTAGFGLFSIREHLSSVGGALLVESRPGRGSRVTLLAPLV